MLQLPTRQSFLAYLLVSLQVSAIFCSAYGFTNWLAAQHHYSYNFWMPWELEIPLIPWMIIFYLSLNLLMLMPIFTLQAEQIKALGKAMTLSTLIAAAIFLLFPAPIGFVRTSQLGFWQPVYQTLFSLDNPTNTFPSLHITFSFLMVRSIVQAKPWLREFFWLWFVAIAASVLLTHQHHVIDILGGIILGEFCYFKFLKNQVSAEAEP